MRTSCTILLLICLSTFALFACNSAATSDPAPTPVEVAAPVAANVPPAGEPVPDTAVPETAVPVTDDSTFHAVSSYANLPDYDDRKVPVGDTAEIVLVSSPVVYEAMYLADGSVGSTSSTAWEPHNVAEMEVCVSMAEPCILDDRWEPFTSTPNAGLFGDAVQQTFTVTVDWVGPRTVWLVMQFRDGGGTPIFAVGGAYQEPQAVVQIALEITGTWDETTQLEAQPPAVQTAVGATRTAFPLTGSVEIAAGSCCIGGMVGDEIQAQVAFTANSSDGEVQEMRTRAAGRCFNESEIEEAEWEPFAPAKSYPVQVAINWIGFYVSVQYRDELGNLSPVFCDDISVEGHPSVTTTP